MIRPGGRRGRVKRPVKWEREEKGVLDMRAAFSVLIAVVVAGCEGSVGQLKSSQDRFTGRETADICIYNGWPGLTESVSMSLARLRTEDGSIEYGLSVFTRNGDGPLWPSRLIWLADGDRIEMTAKASQTTDVNISRGGPMYSEVAFFGATPEDLQRLARANELCFRIYGRNGNGQDACLSEKGVLSARQFVEQVMGLARNEAAY